MDLEEAGVEQEEGGEVTPEIDLESEGTLAEIFANASKGHNLESEPAAETEAETQTEETAQDDSRITNLEGRFQEQNDRLIALQTENNILRHQQNQRGQVETQAPAQQATNLDSDELDLDGFRKATAQDPAGAIFKLFQQAKKTSSVASQGAVEQAKTEAIAVMERQKAYERDQASTIGQFGSLMRENREYANLAENIYAQLVSDGMEVKPGFKWKPGMMLAAASMAYAQMHQAGALKTTPKVISMNQRRTQPQNPLIGRTDADKPKSIASDIPPHELRIMAKTAKEYGMSLEEYLKVFEGLKKNDPHYGT